MAGIPIPKPCTLLNDCLSLGAFDGERRWKSITGDRLYTWDSLHGEVEVFNRRGKHLGVMNCGGEYIKEAKKGRKINV